MTSTTRSCRSGAAAAPFEIPANACCRPGSESHIHGNIVGIVRLLDIWLTHLGDGVKWTLIASACGTILELLFPGPQQSWMSRIKGAFFWGLYILLGASLVLLISRLLHFGS